MCLNAKGDTTESFAGRGPVNVFVFDLILESFRFFTEFFFYKNVSCFLSTTVILSPYFLDRVWTGSPFPLNAFGFLIQTVFLNKF